MAQGEKRVYAVDAVRVDANLGSQSVSHGSATSMTEAKDLARGMLAAHAEAEKAIISYGKKYDRKVIEVKR